MSQMYNKAQVDAIAAIIGNRITQETDPATLKGLIDALADTNFLTNAERSKLAGLTDRFKGTFVSLSAIPITGNLAGMTAHIDEGAGQDVTVAYWDVGDSVWVQGGAAGSETAGSIKTKYESNADTNAFSDAEKSKLAGITEAAGITDFTAALDSAIN